MPEVHQPSLRKITLCPEASAAGSVVVQSNHTESCHINSNFLNESHTPAQYAEVNQLAAVLRKHVPQTSGVQLPVTAKQYHYEGDVSAFMHTGVSYL